MVRIGIEQAHHKRATKILKSECKFGCRCDTGGSSLLDVAGPLSWLDRKDDGTEKVKLFGIASFGFPRLDSGPFYDVYVKVAHPDIRRWIQRKTRNCNHKTCMQG